MGLQPVDNRVEAAGNNVKKNGYNLPVLWELGEAMKGDGDQPSDKHDQIQAQMSAAGLQGLTV